MTHRRQRAFAFARGSHTSYKAGLKAQAKRAPKMRLYLEVLYDRGPQTDHEAYAAMLKTLLLAPTGVQSIRNNAEDLMLVRKRSETHKSPYGGDCHLYELTDLGRAWVQGVRALPTETTPAESTT